MGLLSSSELLSLPVLKVPPNPNPPCHPRQIIVPNLARLPVTHVRCQLPVGVGLATRRRLIVPIQAPRHNGTIELESPQYSSEAATEVATVMTVLNVPKLADALSPQPRPGAGGDDCAVVAVVWVVPLATDARAGSYGGRFGCTFTCNSS